MLKCNNLIDVFGDGTYLVSWEEFFGSEKGSDK
jgi:hypothetical protein